MAKRRKSNATSNASSGERDEREAPAVKPAFASPFKDLKKMLDARAASAPPPSPSPSKPAASAASAPARRREAARIESPQGAAQVAAQAASARVADGPIVDEAALFREAFAGVRRLGAARAERIVAAPEFNRNIVSEDAEVLAELSDLVSGQGNFELTETDEYVEGARVGLDPRLVAQLRRGEYSVQAHLDLHGMIQPDAKEALTTFIVDSVRKGRRAVLIVHGRGRRSPGGQAVLKHAAAQWLSHGLAGGYVLAFATARPSDGGAGAVYVLLRRERRRAKFDVLEGAKRRD
ncbi:MAG TPA: Smr/MutS family protein [Candidatus Binataceae bacterium]|nr:Smr/MutS family protein [Candidatus Binataceae bacterium]